MQQPIDIGIKTYKKRTLPASPKPNSIYYILPLNTTAVIVYVTDVNGIPIKVIDLTGGSGNINSVTGTGVTGTATNPIVNISNFVSSQLNNQVYLSTTDGKLQVNPITSPNASIEINSTSSELQLQLSNAIASQINSAIQPGANISEFTNDVGYITIADIVGTNLTYVPSATNGIVVSNTGTDATIPLAGIINAGLLSPQEKIDIASSVQPEDLAVVAITGEYGDLINIPTEFNPSSHTHSISEVVNLQTTLDGKVDENPPIIGGTGTKITADSKGLVTNISNATTADINDSTNRRYVTDADLVDIGNLSGINSGDQTSIVGITGTKAQFDTEVTDGNILYVGDITQYTDELAQDAVGTILLDSGTIDFTYDDTTPSITAIVKPNSITATELGTVNISEFVNDSSYENTTQLNIRDTNNRARVNHTGTQLSSTISDFTTASRLAVVDDSITNGIIDKSPSENAVFDALALKYDASNPSGYISDVNLGYIPSTVNGIITNDKGIDATIPTVDFTNAGLLTPSEKQLLYNNASTGVTRFDGFTINVDITRFDRGVVEAWFVDNATNPNAPTKVFKTFAATTGNTLTNIATQSVTYIAIDINGGLHQSGMPDEPEIQRDWIPLGVIVHSNRTNINAVNNQPVVALSPNNQLSDLIESIGFFNISGNVFSPNGANLNINKSAGHVFKQGSNFLNNNKDPHTLALSALVAPSNIRYRTQVGTEFANTSTIDTGFYDLAGVRTAIPGTRWSIQRIYLFQSNLIRIQYGQATYITQADAIQAISTEAFVVEQNILENGLFRGLLIVREATTDLTDTSRALFIEASKFGSVAGLGSLSTTSLQQAYDNSLTPEITTNSTLGAVSVKRGSAADTDNIIEGQNGAGVVTSSIKGNGALTALTYNGYTPENSANKVTDFTTVNNTLYPTVQAVKTYADSLVAGLLDDRGSYNASTNLFPTTGGSGTSGAVLKGDFWYVSVAGTLGGQVVNIGDSFRALVDTPAQIATNWSILEGNIGYVPANSTTNINTTSPLLGGGNLTADRTLSIQQATSSQNGYLSSTDWSTFNNKQTALGYTPENVANKSDSYTASSSTTYSSTKALVDGLALKANDANVVHLTGNETKTGTLSLITPNISSGTTALNAISPLIVTGGNGGANTNTTGTVVAGNAQAINIKAGNGGSVSAVTGTGISGNGGDISILAGDGGIATGAGILIPGRGGDAILQGGTAYLNPGSAELKAGNNSSSLGIGANVYLTAGWGNNSSIDDNLYNGSVFLGVSASNTVRGNTVIGNTVDDRSNRLQVTGNSIFNGVIKAEPAVLSNEVVVKSQLDLKAPLSSPAFTGTPTAPTATAGTNTTQLATTAFVLANTATAIAQTITNGVTTSAPSQDAVFDALALKASLNGAVFTGQVEVNSMVGFKTQGSYAVTSYGSGITGPLGVAFTANPLPGWTSNSPITATSFIKSGATAGNILLAGGTDIAQSTFATPSNSIQNQNASAQSANMWISGSAQFGSSVTVNGLAIIQNASYSNFDIKGTSPNDIGGAAIRFSNQTKQFAEISGETFSANNGFLIFRTLSNSINTEILRLAPGQATFSSSVTASSIIASAGTIRLKGYTVATLPAGTQGDTAYVTDATAPTYLGALIGGGAIKCPVFFDGVSWKSH
jgi:hypothetical protein